LGGWINVDATFLTAKIDVWANLEDPLPFRSGTIDVMYSHHVIEHLSDATLPFHLREIYRCLKPGGVLRVGGPNADNAIRKFVERDLSWFSDYPDRRTSIGGKFANFILCRGEHLAILAHSYMGELMTAAGFHNIQPCRPKTETFHPHLIDAAILATESEETPDVPHTLLLEAKKPICLGDMRESIAVNATTK